MSFVDESEDPSTSSGHRINREDESTTRSPIHFQLTLTSTPRRPKPQHEVENISTAQATIVSVKVQWKSKTATRILPDDLGSIGKMLCRGTYTQVARAA